MTFVLRTDFIVGDFFLLRLKGFGSVKTFAWVSLPGIYGTIF
jgi:hypothetical protein